ncbi:MAG: hypothetical protein AAF655_14445 [Bacteroidota bacterium]
MRNINIFLVIILLSISPLAAQQAVEGSYPFMRKMAENANGIRVSLKGTPESVGQAIQEEFAIHTKVKAKKVKKDLYVYESAVIAPISDKKVNYYYRIIPDGKRCTVELFLSPGNNNFWDSDKFYEEMNAAKAMLEGMDEGVVLAQLQSEIEEKKESLEDVEKRQAELVKNEEKMIKQIQKLEEELKANQAEQLKIAERLAAEKTTLENLEQEFSRKNNRR